MTVNVCLPLALVVGTVVLFAVFYLGDGSGFCYFLAIYGRFIVCMYIMVEVTSWYFLIVGWERMGVCSYYLISTFSGRKLANASSAGALAYNRIRDIFLFLSLVSRLYSLVFVAVLTKSSMVLYSGWLPNAMERPTPVSALLHSSTMVVARVYMTVVFSLSSLLLTIVLLAYGFLMGVKGASFGDHKRVIAFSTSSQLVFVAVLGLLGGTQVAVVYVFIHAYFKSLMFMICRYHIHGTNTQSIVNSNNTILMVGSLICLATMSGYPFFNVAKTKDQFLFTGGSDRPLLVCVFLFYAWSTVAYSIRLSTVRSANVVLFSASGPYVSRALLLSLGRFAGGLLSTRSIYRAGGLLAMLVALGALFRLVEPALSGRSVVDTDSYIKSKGLGVSSVFSVGYWRRPAVA